MTETLTPQERAMKHYFETRIKPAIDKGPDIAADYLKESPPGFRGDPQRNKPVDVIFFRNDGKSVGVPIQLKGLIQELTPDEWEAIAMKDRRGVYKGWMWTFFPGVEERLVGKEKLK